MICDHCKREVDAIITDITILSNRNRPFKVAGAVCIHCIDGVVRGLIIGSMEKKNE